MLWQTEISEVRTLPRNVCKTCGFLASVWKLCFNAPLDYAFFPNIFSAIVSCRVNIFSRQLVVLALATAFTCAKFKLDLWHAARPRECNLVPPWKLFLYTQLKLYQGTVPSKIRLDSIIFQSTTG